MGLGGTGIEFLSYSGYFGDIPHKRAALSQRPIGEHRSPGVSPSRRGLSSCAVLDIEGFKLALAGATRVCATEPAPPFTSASALSNKKKPASLRPAGCNAWAP
jgi:hypothetical protein